MYREWTRDFRRCKNDCERAISYLKEGALFKWYEKKTRDIKEFARQMLSDGQGNNTANQVLDKKTSLTIPSILVTMERCSGETSEYDIMFMTRRIAEIVAEVQEEVNWTHNWEALQIYFRDPETRVAAGKRFQKMFLDKFKRQDPDTMPPCYTLDTNSGMHALSPLSPKADMPWKGLG